MVLEQQLVVPVLVLLVSQHASGLQVQVFEGAESILLPCQVPVSKSNGSTSVWDREDLRIPTVHVRQPDGDYLKDQNQRYEGRTSMMEEALQTGDLSLTLRRPTFADSGTFTCTVRRLGEDLHQEAVELLVKVLQSETVEIREGVKSVLLPFKTNKGLPQDVRVEWTRSDQRQIRIHVFENGQTQSEQQEGSYKGRTKMKADLLKTGDLSLTLRTPQLKDYGLYDCVVSRRGEKLLQKAVTLRVKENLMEEVEVPDREEFVLLPFKTAADLPLDSKVVWSRTDKRNIVHEYQNGQNQSARQNQEYLDRTEINPDALRTADLTLTLKDPRLGDSGIFICTVYSIDGKILRRKVVTLTVKVYQVEKVFVEEGRRSVVLPFKVAPHLLSGDTTVEWTLSDLENRVLHRYCKGQNSSTQDQVYGGHTEMNEDLMTTGDLSLTISNVRLSDGVYTCSIYEEHGEILQQKVVVLIVRGLQVEIVEVTKGEPSVSLPFKVPAPLDEDIRVEWTRPDSKQTEVITFKNGGVHASKQSRGYRGRTEMDKDLLTSGDLSLVLKRPHAKDNGFYKCSVYGGEEIQQMKMVTLSVKEPLDTSFTDRLCPTRGRHPTISPQGMPCWPGGLDSSMNQAGPLDRPPETLDLLDYCSGSSSG
ncbi:muscle M-line assembly protein unc-89-like isoform 2-T5 [Anableps anableps]